MAVLPFSVSWHSSCPNVYTFDYAMVSGYLLSGRAVRAVEHA
jgi:hypothetical protein